MAVRQRRYSKEELAKRAKDLYSSVIREKVEVEENIGQMVIIDIETGDYEIDKTGLQASRNLSQKHPNARLFGIRIGYNVAVSLGGGSLIEIDPDRAQRLARIEG
jgi:hypothetical protein